MFSNIVYIKLSFKNACMIFIQFCNCKSQWFRLLRILYERTMDCKPKLKYLTLPKNLTLLDLFRTQPEKKKKT